VEPAPHFPAKQFGVVEPPTGIAAMASRPYISKNETTGPSPALRCMYRNCTVIAPKFYCSINAFSQGIWAKTKILSTKKGGRGAGIRSSNLWLYTASWFAPTGQSVCPGF